MPFEVGQRAIYTSLNGKQEEVTIQKRAVDYDREFIHEFNAKGNFEYLVAVIRDLKKEEIFCKENELTPYE